MIALCDMYNRCQGFPDCCENCMCSPDPSNAIDDYFWSCAYLCCDDCIYQHNFEYCDTCRPCNYKEGA